MKRKGIGILLVLAILVAMIITTTIPTIAAEPELVAYWNLNEGSGTSITDSSGHGNDGTISGASWAGDGNGFNGNALVFDGSNDCVIIPRSDSLNIISEITVDLCFKADVVTGQHALIRKGLFDDNVTKSWGLDIKDSAVRFFIYDNGSGYAATSAPIFPGDWYHVTGTYDGNTVKVYLNGNESGSPNFYPGDIDPNTDDVIIGKHSNTYGLYFDGTIDEIRIWNGALNPPPAPIPELPTIILFGISIFGIVGYIGYRRFRHSHEGIS